MSNFRTILIAIFLAFFVFAVLIFSGAINPFPDKAKDGLKGVINIWGTFPKNALSKAIDTLTTENKNLTVNYVNKEENTYQEDLVQAFAEGKGPDLFIITPDMLIKNKNFIYKIPYASYAEKTFTNSFIDGASIYLDKEGVWAYPLLVDPIVLYYNKDILSNEGIVYPPRTWDELFTMNAALTKRSNSGVISQSMIALGQYANVNNAKEILSTLLIQNDDEIIKRKDLGYVSVLNSNPLGLSVSPIEAVLKFFIEFSNQSDSAYSWNGSLPNSLDMFTSGKLAFYIGKASELFNIQSINPNLIFNVNQIPQIKDATTKRTYGEIYAIAVNKKTANLAAAFKVAGDLTTGDKAKSISTSMSLPPVSRDLLNSKPNENPYLFTFFNSAIITKSWIDPDEIKTDGIFKELIENILSNTLSLGEAVGKAQGQFEQIIKK